MLQEDSQNRFTDLNRGQTFKVAKVIGVNQWDNSVDLAFLDGNFATGVPVLTGFAGSNFGVTNLIAPSVDSKSPASATYPQPINDDNVIQPLSTGLPETPVLLTGLSNRDIYAVVSSFAGPRVTTGGYFVLGFIYPNITEMKFPEQVGVLGDNPPNEFIDFTLLRHPSDFQISIDQNAVLSMQHPCGARITIGDEYANQTPGASPLVTGVGNVLDLTQRDFNNLYQIRNNKSRKAAIVVEDCFGAHFKLNKGSASIVDGKGDTIIVGPTNIIIEDYTQKNSIVLDQTEGIVLASDMNSITVASSQNGNQELQMTGNESIDMGTQKLQLWGNTTFGGQPELYIDPNHVTINSNDSMSFMSTNTLNIDGGQAISLSSDGTINIVAGTAINLRAPVINILPGPIGGQNSNTGSSGGQGSGGNNIGNEVFLSGIAITAVIEGLNWYIYETGLDVAFFNPVLGLAIIAVGLFLNFLTFLGLFDGGVPRDAKTHGAGYVLSRNSDPILAYIGSQLVHGAANGRVISESTGAQSFESAIAALGSALVELGNYGFNPQPYWKILSTSQFFTNAEIGPIPPPPGSPYSEQVYIADDFGAPAIQTASEYQTNEGFPIPTRQQLVSFLSGPYRPYWFQVPVPNSPTDFNTRRAGGHQVVFSQYLKFYQEVIL